MSQTGIHNLNFDSVLFCFQLLRPYCFNKTKKKHFDLLKDKMRNRPEPTSFAETDENDEEQFEEDSGEDWKPEKVK